VSSAASSSSASCARLNIVGFVRLGRAPRGPKAPPPWGAAYDLRWRRGRFSAGAGPKYGMSNWGTLGPGCGFFKHDPMQISFYPHPTPSQIHLLADPGISPPSRPSLPLHFNTRFKKKRGEGQQRYPRFSPRKGSRTSRTK
jgi:hypothetical protein